MRKLKQYSEAQALEIIEKVVTQLSKQFQFGYYDVDDLKQEGTIFALKAIEDGTYDENRPLENFLRVFIKNRFINLKRNKYFRTAIPCHSCPLYDEFCKQSDNQCLEYKDKLECDKYAIWHKLNYTKRNLVDCIDVAGVNDENEKNMKGETYVESQLETNELFTYIDEHLPAEMRADYLKMITNYGAKLSHQAKISKSRQETIRQTIKKLMEDYYGRNS